MLCQVGLVSANARIFTNDCCTNLLSAKRRGRSTVLECELTVVVTKLTVAVTKSQEEKHRAFRQKTYSEKRVKCH